MSAYNEIIKELRGLDNPEKAKLLAGFFKTGKGEYGAGDKFLGIVVPEQRKVVKKYAHLELPDIQKLLQSPYHEFRLTGLLVLVEKITQADKQMQKEIFKFYLKNIAHINNWDLVDLTAPKIAGEYLLDKPEQRKILYKLARSKNLWERRIAILATFAFIRQDDFSDTLKIAAILLQDKYDLIHKAVGWALREVGKRDQKTAELFLQKHLLKMPRTTLRYAIERFPEEKRRSYLKKIA